MSKGKSLLDCYLNPDLKADTIKSVSAGHRNVILIDNLTFSRDFPEMAFEGTYQLSKKILGAGSTPLLLMTSSPDAGEFAKIKEHTYRIANGCGIHVIPAGGAVVVQNHFSIESLSDDLISYFVACMLFNYLTDASIVPRGNILNASSRAGASAPLLASWSKKALKKYSTSKHYNSSTPYAGIIRYRSIDISKEPFFGEVHYIYKGTSTEDGTSKRLNEIINTTYLAVKKSLGRREGPTGEPVRGGPQTLYQNDLVRHQKALDQMKDLCLFLYVRATEVSADTVHSFSQKNLLPIIYDRPYALCKNTCKVKSTPHTATSSYLCCRPPWVAERDAGRQATWMEPCWIYAALGRFYNSIHACLTNDSIHISDPLYYMLASQ